MDASKTISTKLLDGPSARLIIDQAEVRVVGGPDRGAKLALGADNVVIGSSPNCDLVLHDSTVSGRHAEVVATPRGYYISDLGSTNGLLLGTTAIDRIPLQDGIRLILGESAIAIHSLGTQLTVPLIKSGEFAGLIARSVKMRAFAATLMGLAASEATVLIEGETGTGKEMAAMAVHKVSGRRMGPFVVVDCSALNRSLAAAELFGHDRGAFTGANEARPGLAEEADGGTLFLDEIGELPLDLQPLLLGLLERKQTRRIGGKSDIRLDVRVVAATNRNLAEEVRAKRFRQDLYYRLAVGRVRLPPLRERLEDLPILADIFAREAGIVLSPETLAPLTAYDWPGNVRELRNVLTHIAVHGKGPEPVIPQRKRSAMLYDDEGNLRPWLDVRQLATSNIEREYLVEVLAFANGNLSRAADIAGITRQSLTTLASKHGLHPRGE